LISTFAYYPRRLFIDFLAMVGPWFPNEPSPSSSRSIRSFFFFGPGISKADQDAWWDYTVDVPALAYGHRFTLLAALDLRSRLAEIASPALVFAASNDWIVPHPASRLLASKLPRARLIMSNTGHAAMIDPRINIAHWLESAELWDSKKGIGMIPNVPSAHE
jgi:pimeloyl-ACP methyl ester carboxylesterase